MNENNNTKVFFMKCGDVAASCAIVGGLKASCFGSSYMVFLFLIKNDITTDVEILNISDIDFLRNVL